ncbi:LA2681 family HEPN domain-containing protein [Phreatobacter stygius]|uniref:LA2681-like HEPN domain-containing protein n=1 Tax=Phreatobacter stygius TaxID=1940610 RepID=A0A4D7AQ87_9HYPH|nr:LA2681 family HEPN domain-containing protein [Phreatobacter stygius]QCI63149.1 hypothetical protein E8M01_02190 [Phreatobacter stygius]
MGKAGEGIDISLSLRNFIKFDLDIPGLHIAGCKPLMGAVTLNSDEMSDLDREIKSLAQQIDSAPKLSDTTVLKELDERCVRILSIADSRNASRIWYYRSNIYSSLQNLTDPRSWKWRQPDRERQILYLRRARAELGFSELSSLIRAQITTNLANSLNSLGRGVEAIEIYEMALDHHPDFAMALANRGRALIDLARCLRDSGYVAPILLAAHHDLTAAASPQAVWDGLYPGMRDNFIVKIREIEAVMDVSAVRAETRLEGHNLGRSNREKAYRRWALDNRLFLSPLNVLGPHTIAATDHFGLPGYRAPRNDPPQFVAWYNQLMQEYVAARLFFFESTELPANHFADRELALVDTLDSPAFGLSLEKMRSAFRIAYSLLDKVAGFINAYFQLGLNPERVNLRGVWLNRNGRSIRSEFLERPNLALRGLYWLALDVVGERPTDVDAITPEASELHRLRNALEHRCLVLREIDTAQRFGVVETETVEVFLRQTLKMMKLARASLLYLSFAVHQEEEARAEVDQRSAFAIDLPAYNGRLQI